MSQCWVNTQKLGSLIPWLRTGGCNEDTRTEFSWAIINGHDGDAWIDPDTAKGKADAFDILGGDYGPRCLFMTEKKHGCDYRSKNIGGGESTLFPFVLVQLAKILIPLKLTRVLHYFKEIGLHSGSDRQVRTHSNPARGGRD